MRFTDRSQAGRELARQVAAAAPHDPVVLALPRGGVPVAWEVAEALGAPLDVFVVRKIGAPGHKELGIGAIAEGDGGPLVADVARRLRVTREQIDQQVATERAELRRQVADYRADRPLPDVAGHDVILVDDGLATGVTAEAALNALRTRGPRRLVLAAPVCAKDTATRLGQVADEVTCVSSRADFISVGAWYEDFAQVTDDDVLHLLRRSHTRAVQPTTHEARDQDSP